MSSNLFKVPELNYTQIPNILFDEWIPKLKQAELRVLLVIMRQTFGWQNKKWDQISNAQLVKKTGLKRQCCTKAANSLIAKGLISKKITGSEGNQQIWYSMQVENSEKTRKSIEEPENSNISYPGEFGTPPLVNLVPRPKITTTKETTIPTISSLRSEIPLPKKRRSIPEPKKEIAKDVWLSERQIESLKEKIKLYPFMTVESLAERLSDWKIGKNIHGGKNDYSSIIKWVINAALESTQEKSKWNNNNKTYQTTSTNSKVNSSGQDSPAPVFATPEEVRKIFSA